MGCVRDELRQGGATRPVLPSPARVAGPLLGGTAAIVVAFVAAEVLGLAVLPALLVTLVVGVLAGFAVQRTLGALVAGFTLLLARPYAPGEQILIELPEFGGLTEAEVVHVGAANTALRVDDRLVVVANSRFFSAR
jgi:small-conductance mechanosensitive channel